MTPVFTGRDGRQCIAGVNTGPVHGCPKIDVRVYGPCSGGSVYLLFERSQLERAKVIL